MKTKNIEIERFRDKEFELSFYGINGDSQNGVFKIPYKHQLYTVIASNGGGWEHVSVSGDKTPSWNCMCYMKDLFFNDEETVIQFHPKKSEYVNLSKTCLHLWRNIEKEAELPPKILTGV